MNGKKFPLQLFLHKVSFHTDVVWVTVQLISRLSGKLIAGVVGGHFPKAEFRNIEYMNGTCHSHAENARRSCFASKSRASTNYSASRRAPHDRRFFFCPCPLTLSLFSGSLAFLFVFVACRFFRIDLRLLLRILFSPSRTTIACRLLRESIALFKRSSSSCSGRQHKMTENRSQKALPLYLWDTSQVSFLTPLEQFAEQRHPAWVWEPCPCLWLSSTDPLASSTDGRGRS